jgi:hypothetical protein
MTITSGLAPNMLITIDAQVDNEEERGNYGNEGENICNGNDGNEKEEGAMVVAPNITI